MTKGFRIAFRLSIVAIAAIAAILMASVILWMIGADVSDTFYIIIFQPLTLIVGWYGMNFEGMLAPSVPWGYPTVGAVCAVLVVGGLLFFHHRGML